MAKGKANTEYKKDSFVQRYSPKNNPEATTAALLGFGTNFANQYLSNLASSQSYESAAEALKSQSRLDLINAYMQNEMLNRQYSYDIWGINYARRQVEGSTLTNAAYSNFDLSTGDIRIMAANDFELARRAETLQEQARLQSRELFRQAYINKIENDSRAKIAQLNADYASGWRGTLSNVLSSGMSALGTYFSFVNNYAKYDSGSNIRKVNEEKLNA